MRIILTLFCTLFLCAHHDLLSQSQITVYPDSVQQNLGQRYEYGTFYVPKTIEAQTDFLGNGDHLNSVRLHIIESALNNSSDLNGALTYLDNVSSVLQSISAKTDKVIFIFEKMPAWLSSSSDGSPAQTPGWFVLNTKPPASYLDWNNMVQQITTRIVTNYGISNAYFEIWNEPDLGSWTGSQVEYFQLFQSTYDAIKGVNSSLPVGGPATNHWANNINYSAPFGYISSINGEQSLIAQLIDSTYIWNKPLDFISWHNFNMTVETHENAIDFISEKYNTLSFTLPELIVSEWNAPSAVRDTDLHYSFAVKNTIAIKSSEVANDVIAAWQDFSSSTNEFHSDYGLLTYGSIRKPFFNAISLASEIKGNQVKAISNVPLSFTSSLTNDTLNLLISNYNPPAIVEALNHTLFNGQWSITDLDTAGYINIATNDLSVLESIYNGSTVIPSNNLLNQSINNSIPIYNYYDSTLNILNNVEINLSNYIGNYSGILYTINDSTNNDQFTYDSLLNIGYTQANAISAIQGSQQLKNQNIDFNSGTYTLSMKPNSVHLIQLVMTNLAHTINLDQENSTLQIYPNPSFDVLNLKSQSNNIGEIQICTALGQFVLASDINSQIDELDISMLSPGIYLIKHNNHSYRFVKK